MSAIAFLDVICTMTSVYVLTRAVFLNANVSTLLCSSRPIVQIPVLVTAPKTIRDSSLPCAFKRLYTERLLDQARSRQGSQATGRPGRNVMRVAA